MSALKSKAVLGIVLGLALGTVGSAQAAFDAAKVEKARMDKFHEMGKAFKTIVDGLKADNPDTKSMSAQAHVMVGLSHKVTSWFPKGSGPEAGIKTRAKGEIWTDWATFAAAAKGLETESAKLEAVTRAGNLDAIKLQVKATGNACGTCHTKFRGPELDKHEG